MNKDVFVSEMTSTFSCRIVCTAALLLCYCCSSSHSMVEVVCFSTSFMKYYTDLALAFSAEVDTVDWAAGRAQSWYSEGGDLIGAVHVLTVPICTTTRSIISCCIKISKSGFLCLLVGCAADAALISCCNDSHPHSAARSYFIDAVLKIASWIK